MSREPQPNLVGYPKTREQFEVSAKFARYMAAKSHAGKFKSQRDPKLSAEIYLKKAEEYERIARGMV